MTQVADKTTLEGWLESLRQAGRDRFEAVGLPSTREEEWRFTNVAPLGRIDWAPADLDGESAAREASRWSLGNETAAELVFVNGHYMPLLSTFDGIPATVRAGSLAEAMRIDSRPVRRHLGRYAAIEANPFVAWNAANLSDGAYVHLGRGVEVKKPIHLLFVSVPVSGPTVAHPRVLVVADEGATAGIVESYVGSGTGTYLTNAVTEIVAAEGAHLDHCRLQQETLEAYHLAAMHVELATGANLISHAASLGAKLSRTDLNVGLNGERAEATINGLVVIGGEQHCDNHTLLRHEKPNCPSHELYKHVLADKASGVFKGKILVQREAQKTDSKQTSKTLLLSDNAVMDSMPALEIYADDVKCTHGSTIGPVDEEMIFYLRSRGVSLEAARHLLTYAFAADITRRIKVEPVRRRLEDFMARQHGLPQDLRITDLGEHDEKAR